MTDVSKLQVVVGADTKEAEASLGKLNDSITSGFGIAVGSKLLETGLSAIAGGFAASVGEAMDFEKQLSSIKAVSGATSQEMEKLSKLSLQLGADTSFSAKESAQGIEELVKGGVDIKDIMGGAAKAALDLAAAGEISVADSATIAANAMAQFGIKGSEMGHVSDLIAGAANASALSVGDFKYSLTAAGAVAATVGFSFDDLATSIAVMGKAGITGSDAGTSLKTMMMRLVPQTKEARSEFAALGLTAYDANRGLEILGNYGIDAINMSLSEQQRALQMAVTGWDGMSTMTKTQAKNWNEAQDELGLYKNQFFDATGKVKSMAEVSQILSTALKDQTEEQKLATLQTLFGSDAIRAAAILTKEGADGFNAMSEAMAKVSAASVAEERLNNLSGSLEKFKGSMSTVGILVGSVLLGPLKLLVDWGTELLNAMLPSIQAFSEGFPGAVKTFMAQVSEFIGQFTGPVNEALNAFWELLGVKIQDGLKLLTDVVWPELRRAINDVWTWVETDIFPIITELLDYLGPKLNEIMTWLFTTGFPEVGRTMSAVWEFIKTYLSPIIGVLIREGLTLLKDSVIWFIETGWPAFTRLAEAVLKGIQDLYKWFGDLSAELAKTGAYDALGKLWQELKDLGAAILNDIIIPLIPKMGEAGGSFEGFGNIVKDVVVFAINALIAALRVVVGLAKLAVDAIGKVIEWYGKLKNAAGKAFDAIERVRDVPNVEIDVPDMPDLGVQAMAAGGWINEPVMGVGRSGRRYLLGESGPEYVTPAGRMGAPSIIQVPVSIGGRVIEELFITGRDLAVRRGRAVAATV